MTMSIKGKNEYLQEVKLRYLNGSWDEKGKILEEACLVTGMHRKSLIRHFHRTINNQFKEKLVRKRGRKSIYDYPEFRDTLTKVWQETDQMCSKNLKAALPVWLPFYEKQNGQIPLPTREKLLKISAASIDRIINPWRQRFGKGACGTKPGTLLRTAIPIRTDNWDVTMPGYLEADTVAHCGGSLLGEFIWSLTLTDIHSQWTEIRAVWHKASGGIIDRIKSVEDSLPFKIIAFDSDNGGEFINQYLYKFFAERDKIIHFTRSRPYKKNDNAHVEQKNWTHVRKLLKYQRLDNPAILEPLNNILINWSMLKNHFHPCRKLSSKERINSAYRKLYDDPKTPYLRLIESSGVSEEQKNKLKQIHVSLDPVVIRRKIRKDLKTLLDSSLVTPNCEASYHKQRLK